EDLQRLNGTIDRYLGLIETGELIAREIEEGRIDDANQLYFTSARPDYKLSHGDLYTLVIAAERRVASMARISCE
ncbi:MAG: hypothetical protein ACKVPY_18055, partial [Paracoccaceae bacterium]